MIVPRATYRLQLHRGFSLNDAAGIVEFLSSIGVSHVYLSPILQSAPGSTHGYDVVDPTRIDSDRGGADGFGSLLSACRRVGLGIVVDIVPNHVDVGSPHNPWWQSVLRLGPASAWAKAFDIEWEACPGRDAPAVLLSVLGSALADELAAGRVRLIRDGGSICVGYYEKRFPLRPESVAQLLANAAMYLTSSDGVTALAAQYAAAGEGGGVDGARASVVDVDALDRLLGALLVDRDDVAAAADGLLARTNEDAAALQRLLDAQHYRLAYWKGARNDLNYRRFFNVDNLGALRVDVPAVFDAAHGLVLKLVADGAVNGLRVDHPDGLRDPRGYFERLRSGAGEAWIVAEKILQPGERLRDAWPIDGTTGYDFLNEALGVLVDPAAEAPLSRTYDSFVDGPTELGEIDFEARMLAAKELLAADLKRLVRIVERCAERHGRLDHAPALLAEAVATFAAVMPIYRTYVQAERGEIDDADVRAIEFAADAAARRRPDLAPEPIAALRDLLLLRMRSDDGGDGSDAPEDDFVARFQQYSAPVMAKGVEDTAFYRFNRFVALNEVGGEPDRFGIGLAAFHEAMQLRAARWPRSMLTTSTHDTKRGEDVRARLAAISEVPAAWDAAVNEWSRMAREIAGHTKTTRAAEYLLYQTLVGAWPIEADRVVAFMTKAAREAKTRTSWVANDEAYEAALESFVRSVMGDEGFCRSIDAFVDCVRRAGRVKGLAQLLLKLTCPGVPDVYQGCELWDSSLVDPDNRRAVDFDLRRRLAAELEKMSPAAVWRTLDDGDDAGVSKLFTLQQGLAIRRHHPAVFGAESGYQPMDVSGSGAERVLAFARCDRDGAARVCVVVPRLTVDGEAARSVTIDLPRSASGGAWRQVLSGESIETGRRSVAELFGIASLALLAEVGE